MDKVIKIVMINYCHDDNNKRHFIVVISEITKSKYEFFKEREFLKMKIFIYR